MNVDELREFLSDSAVEEGAADSERGLARLLKRLQHLQDDPEEAARVAEAVDRDEADREGYRLGYDALQRFDYAAATRLLRPSAEHGHPEAAAYLAAALEGLRAELAGSGGARQAVDLAEEAELWRQQARAAGADEVDVRPDMVRDAIPFYVRLRSDETTEEGPRDRQNDDEDRYGVEVGQPMADRELTRRPHYRDDGDNLPVLTGVHDRNVARRAARVRRRTGTCRHDWVTTPDYDCPACLQRTWRCAVAAARGAARTPADVDDVAIEATYDIVMKRTFDKNRSRFPTFVATVAKNKARLLYQRLAREQRELEAMAPLVAQRLIDTDEPGVVAFEAESAFREAELKLVLMEALKAVSPDNRQAFVMLLAGYSRAHIARTVLVNGRRLSPQAWTSRLLPIRQRVQAALDFLEDGSP